MTFVRIQMGCTYLHQACAWFLEITLMCECMYACVCVYAPKAKACLNPKFKCASVAMQSLVMSPFSRDFIKMDID